MPDVQPPASREQINEFLRTVLPTLDKEFDNALALFSSTAETNATLRLVEAVNASYDRRMREELDILARQMFFERMNIYTYHDALWAHHFASWCLHIVRDFVSQSVEQRAQGLMYTLPKGLTAQFEAATPEERAQILVTISRPRLQVTEADNRTNVLVFRQVT